MELTRWIWHHYGWIHNWICLLVIPDYKFAQIKLFDFRTWTYAKILERLTQDPGDTLYHFLKKCLFFYQLVGKHWTKLISILVQTGSQSTEQSGFSLKLERFHVLGYSSVAWWWLGEQDKSHHGFGSTWKLIG